MGQVPDIVFRPARPDDVPVCVDLYLAVFQDDMERLFGRLKPGVTARDAVAALCRADDTELSWRNFLLVEHGGTVVAGLSAFSAEARPVMARQMPARLQTDCGFGILVLSRVLLRSVWYGIGQRGPELPGESLYISAGAVFPAYQRYGIAKRTLAYLFERARAEGYRSICLHVERANHAAMNLYTALGFKESPSAARPGHRVLMVRELPFPD